MFRLKPKGKNERKKVFTLSLHITAGHLYSSSYSGLWGISIWKSKINNERINKKVWSKGCSIVDWTGIRKEKKEKLYLFSFLDCFIIVSTDMILMEIKINYSEALRLKKILCWVENPCKETGVTNNFVLPAIFIYCS